MGYIIGGKIQPSPLITSATDADFQQAKTITQVPSILPSRTAVGLQTLQNARAKYASGVTDVTRTAPLFNDPRYTSSTLAIPTDDRTLHGLYRFFAETDPIVGSALRIHTELPLADLRLGTCEDSGIQQHYEEMWERINGLKLLSDITTEYHEIGNSFVFGAFNEADYMWDQFAILNPDYVKVESTWVNQKPLIKLIPDEALKKVVQTQSPKYIYEQLPPEIIRYVLFNQEIPLDPNNIFHLAHAKRPYETKGRSIIKRILKVLMLEDRFNQANFALATRHAVPLTVVKVGDPQTGWVPDEAELNAVRDMMANFELDPNFSIIYHYGINIEFYGSNGRMLPIGPELDRIYKLKFIGLNIHEQLMSGQGGTYAQAYVNLEVQRQRYLNLQLKLETFMHQGVFKPVADLCGFYRVKQAVAGYGGVTSSRWGKGDNIRRALLAQYKSLRDYQDNIEFREFIARKISEIQAAENKQTREYVYPKLDWGSMSAATDENLKNWIKWLAKERPWLIDDATLARLARLDRDTQERAYIEDLKRKRDRTQRIAREGLLPFVQTQKGGPGGEDFGGIGDINLAPPGGGEDLGVGMGGGEEPGAPIGAGGPPETAGGTVPPPSPGGAVSSLSLSDTIKSLAREITSNVTQSDLTIVEENKQLQAQKKFEDVAIIEAVGRH